MKRACFIRISLLILALPLTENMTNIIFIEEHHLFRSALKCLINTFDNCNVEKDVPSIDFLLKQQIEKDPEIIIVSIYDVLEAGEEKVEQLKERFLTSQIVVFSDQLNHEEADVLRKAGAYAFFCNESNPFELRNLLETFSKYEVMNEMIIDRETLEHLRNTKRQPSIEPIEFSKREVEVLNLVCQERTNIEISELLGLSIRTIESFRRRMITKAGCKNMIGVVLKAIQQKQNVIHANSTALTVN